MRRNLAFLGLCSVTSPDAVRTCGEGHGLPSLWALDWDHLVTHTMFSVGIIIYEPWLFIPPLKDGSGRDACVKLRQPEFECLGPVVGGESHLLKAFL